MANKSRYKNNYIYYADTHKQIRKENVDNSIKPFVVRWSLHQTTSA